MKNGAKGGLCHAKGDQPQRVGMYHGLYVRTRAVDAAVDKTLAVTPALAADDVAVEVVFQNVLCGHLRWCQAAGHIKAIGILGITDAYMAESVEHTLVVMRLP